MSANRYAVLLESAALRRMISAIRRLDRGNLTGADWVPVLDLLARQRKALERQHAQGGLPPDADQDSDLATLLGVLLRMRLRELDSDAPPRFHVLVRGLTALVGCPTLMIFAAAVEAERVEPAILAHWLGACADVGSYVTERASPGATGAAMLLHRVIRIGPRWQEHQPLGVRDAFEEAAAVAEAHGPGAGAVLIGVWAGLPPDAEPRARLLRWSGALRDRPTPTWLRGMEKVEAVIAGTDAVDLFLDWLPRCPAPHDGLDLAADAIAALWTLTEVPLVRSVLDAVPGVQARFDSLCASDLLEAAAMLGARSRLDVLHAILEAVDRLAGSGAEGHLLAQVVLHDSPAIARLDPLPDVSWLESLVPRLLADPRRFRAFESELVLLGPSVSSPSLARRWRAACDRLRQRGPTLAGPCADDVPMAGRTPDEIESLVATWERFAEHGFRCPLAPIVRTHALDAAVGPGDDEVDSAALFAAGVLTAARCDAPLEDALAGWRASPRLCALDTPALREEILRERARPVRRTFRSVEERGLAGGTLRLSELRAFVDAVGLERIGLDRVVRELRAALRRHRFDAPLLEAASRVARGAPPVLPFTHLEASVADNYDDAAVLAGDDVTGSCTDGPGGPESRHAVVHALHARGFTLMVCATRPAHPGVARTPLLTAAGFLAEVDGTEALLIDTFEAGFSLTRIPGGLELASSLVRSVLGQLADREGLPVVLGAGRCRPEGAFVRRTLVEEFGVAARRARIDIAAADLLAMGEATIYLETGAAGVARIGDDGWVRLVAAEVFAPPPPGS